MIPEGNAKRVGLERDLKINSHTMRFAELSEAKSTYKVTCRRETIYRGRKLGKAAEISVSFTLTRRQRAWLMRWRGILTKSRHLNTAGELWVLYISLTIFGDLLRYLLRRAVFSSALRFFISLLFSIYTRARVVMWINLYLVEFCSRTFSVQFYSEHE